MKPRQSTLADITAFYPSSVFEPEDQRDDDDTGFSHSETLAAIASPYEYELEYLPARFPVPVVTVGGNPRTVVAYNPALPPSAGQVAISFDFPLIEFAPEDVGLVPELDYTAVAGVITSRLINQLQVEVAAISGATAGLSPLGTNSNTWTTGADDDADVTHIWNYFGNDTTRFFGWSNPTTGIGRFLASDPIDAPSFWGAATGLTGGSGIGSTTASSFRFASTTDVSSTPAMLIFGQDGGPTTEVSISASSVIFGAVEVYSDIFHGAFDGSGASLIDLDASELSSGTVADARLSSEVVLKTASQILTNKIFGGGATVTGAPLHCAAGLTYAMDINGSDGSGVRVWGYPGIGTSAWSGIAARTWNTAVSGSIVGDNLVANRDAHWERNGYGRRAFIIGDGRAAWAWTSAGDGQVPTTYGEGVFAISSWSTDPTSANPTPHPDCQQFLARTSNEGTHFCHHTPGAIQGSVSTIFIFDDTVVAPEGFSTATAPKLLYAATSAATIANSTTETTLQSYNLAAGLLTVGKVVRVRAGGSVLDMTGAVTGITIRVKLGAVVLEQAYLEADASEKPFVFDADFTCRTVGASGTVAGSGTLSTYDENTTQNASYAVEDSDTVDTTGALAVSITIQLATADAAYSASVKTFTVEVLG